MTDQPIFYQPDFGEGNAWLSPGESHHAARVLRLVEGDGLAVVDGAGGRYHGQLTHADARRCQVRILATDHEPPVRPWRVHVALTPTKNADRTEWFVEKCVEIGVDALSFVVCDRSERRHFTTDRVTKVAVAAMKQSQRAWLPRLYGPVPLATFVQTSIDSQRFIAHLGEVLRPPLQALAQPTGEVCVLIGPEGDFSPAEIALALAHGFAPVSLGAARLRTETAGVVACHLLNLL